MAVIRIIYLPPPSELISSLTNETDTAVLLILAAAGQKGKGHVAAERHPHHYGAQVILRHGPLLCGRHWAKVSSNPARLGCQLEYRAPAERCATIRGRSVKPVLPE